MSGGFFEKQRIKQPRSNSLLYRVIILATIAICFRVAAADAAPFPRQRIVFPFVPAAAVDGPSALRFNPAGLAFDPGFGANYYHTFSDSSLSGDDAAYLSLHGGGFGVEWLGAGGSPKGRAYSVGMSTNQDQAFAIGGSYQWRRSDDPTQNKSHFWSYGLTWRPTKTFSLAVVLDNYNRMPVSRVRTDREYVYSAAVNLLDRRLMVGGDWYQTSSQNLWAGTYRLGASFEIHSGLTAFADIDRNKNFFIGGRVNLANVFAGTHSSFRHNGRYQGGVAYVGLNETRRKPVVRMPREVVHLRLSGEIPDRRPPRHLFGASPLTTYEWTALLDKAASDPSIGAVILTIDSPKLGWARLEEMRRAIARVRQTGKLTLAYLHGPVSNGEYYLATAADRIVTAPVSTTDLVGLKAEVTFVKRLLDKVGVRADMEHIGEYKNASDLLTRTKMSEAHRAALNRLLDDLDGVWVNEMAHARGVTPDRVRQWIAHGPYVSVDAQADGLIDGVAYADELDSLVRNETGRFGRNIGGRQLASRRYYPRCWGSPPRVAVICAEGTIMDGQDREEFLVGDVMGAGTIRDALRQARHDRHVKAIVLRVNSGGGSVFASDEIWREVSRTVGHKPITVSFADEAASGGYYIACAADSIFALPETITGSIGIISGKLDMSGLYDKIGFDKEVLTRGRYADLLGTTRSFDDQERAIIKDQMARAYQRFVDLVAEGRKLSPDSVNAIGQGRVWSGTAARDMGLVDRFTDLHGAIEASARMAGVKPGEQVEVELLPKTRWALFDRPLASLLTQGAFTSGLTSILEWLDRGNADDFVYEMPFSLTIH